MKRILVAVAASAIAAAAGGSWSFQGKWGTRGSGEGQFIEPVRVAVAADGTVYVADWGNGSVQYFTATGSFLGKSGRGNRVSWAFAPNRWTYEADVDDHRVRYYDENGSFLGKWGALGTGPGQFDGPMGLAVAYNGVVDVADTGNRRIQYFTPTGSYIGEWYAPGEPLDVAVAGSGEFYAAYYPNVGVAVAPDTGYVYYTDAVNHRIRYYTGSGSFLAEFGSYGTGDGEFDGPSDVAFSPSGARLSVVDTGNCRIQYFNRNEPAVFPASLGKVKATFE